MNSPAKASVAQNQLAEAWGNSLGKGTDFSVLFAERRLGHANQYLASDQETPRQEREVVIHADPQAAPCSHPGPVTQVPARDTGEARAINFAFFGASCPEGHDPRPSRPDPNPEMQVQGRERTRDQSVSPQLGANRPHLFSAPAVQPSFPFRFAREPRPSELETTITVAHAQATPVAPPGSHGLGSPGPVPPAITQEGEEDMGAVGSRGVQTHTCPETQVRVGLPQVSNAPGPHPEMQVPGLLMGALLVQQASELTASQRHPGTGPEATCIAVPPPACPVTQVPGGGCTRDIRPDLPFNLAPRLQLSSRFQAAGFGVRVGRELDQATFSRRHACSPAPPCHITGPRSFPAWFVDSQTTEESRTGAMPAHPSSGPPAAGVPSPQPVMCTREPRTGVMSCHEHEHGARGGHAFPRHQIDEGGEHGGLMCPGATPLEPAAHVQPGLPHRFAPHLRRRSAATLSGNGVEIRSHLDVPAPHESHVVAPSLPPIVTTTHLAGDRRAFIQNASSQGSVLVIGAPGEGATHPAPIPESGPAGAWMIIPASGPPDLPNPPNLHHDAQGQSTLTGPQEGVQSAAGHSRTAGCQGSGLVVGAPEEGSTPPAPVSTGPLTRGLGTPPEGPTPAAPLDAITCQPPSIQPQEGGGSCSARQYAAPTMMDIVWPSLSRFEALSPSFQAQVQLAAGTGVGSGIETPVEGPILSDPVGPSAPTPHIGNPPPQAREGAREAPSLGWSGNVRDEGTQATSQGLRVGSPRVFPFFKKKGKNADSLRVGSPRVFPFFKEKGKNAENQGHGLTSHSRDAAPDGTMEADAKPDPGSQLPALPPGEVQPGIPREAAILLSHAVSFSPNAHECERHAPSYRSRGNVNDDGVPTKSQAGCDRHDLLHYVYPNLATFEALRLGAPLPHIQGAASEDTPPGPFPFNHAADLRVVMHRDHDLGVGTPVEGPMLPDPVGRIAQPGIDNPAEGTIPAAPGLALKFPSCYRPPSGALPCNMPMGEQLQANASDPKPAGPPQEGVKTLRKTSSVSRRPQEGVNNLGEIGGLASETCHGGLVASSGTTSPGVVPLGTASPGVVPPLMPTFMDGPPKSRFSLLESQKGKTGEAGCLRPESDGVSHKIDAVVCGPGHPYEDNMPTHPQDGVETGQTVSGSPGSDSREYHVQGAINPDQLGSSSAGVTTHDHHSQEAVDSPPSVRSGLEQPPASSQAGCVREGPEVDGSIPESLASNLSFSHKNGGLQPPILVPRMGGWVLSEETCATAGRAAMPVGPQLPGHRAPSGTDTNPLGQHVPGWTNMQDAAFCPETFQHQGLRSQRTRSSVHIAPKRPFRLAPRLHVRQFDGGSTPQSRDENGGLQTPIVCEKERFEASGSGMEPSTSGPSRTQPAWEETGGCSRPDLGPGPTEGGLSTASCEWWSWVVTPALLEPNWSGLMAPCSW